MDNRGPRPVDAGKAGPSPAGNPPALLNTADRASAVLEGAVNVASNGATETERRLSNLAPAPFDLDGRRYASVEGFWQGLKFPDQARRDEIARMSGLPSKKIGDEAPKCEAFAYEGATYRVGSPEHYALMYRAVRAKLEQNPDVLRLLLETGDRPIVHRPLKKDGTPYPDSVTVPEAVFSGMLMRLRKEMAG